LEISLTEVAVVSIVNTIQPRVITIGAATNVTFNESQPVANMPVDDVPNQTEAMCAQPPSSDKGTYMFTASRWAALLQLYDLVACLGLSELTNDSLQTTVVTSSLDNITTTTVNCRASHSDDNVTDDHQ